MEAEEGFYYRPRSTYRVDTLVYDKEGHRENEVVEEDLGPLSERIKNYERQREEDRKREAARANFNDFKKNLANLKGGIRGEEVVASDWTNEESSSEYTTTSDDDGGTTTEAPEMKPDEPMATKQTSDWTSDCSTLVGDKEKGPDAFDLVINNSTMEEPVHDKSDWAADAILALDKAVEEPAAHVKSGVKTSEEEEEDTNSGGTDISAIVRNTKASQVEKKEAVVAVNTVVAQQSNYASHPTMSLDDAVRTTAASTGTDNGNKPGNPFGDDADSSSDEKTQSPQIVYHEEISDEEIDNPKKMKKAKRGLCCGRACGKGKCSVM